MTKQTLKYFLGHVRSLTVLQNVSRTWHMRSLSVLRKRTQVAGMQVAGVKLASTVSVGLRVQQTACEVPLQEKMCQTGERFENQLSDGTWSTFLPVTCLFI